ncbi:hypothetical protein ORIO_20240 (plasmid) [Cereibacter azotoformans]|uniref:hypothetical protein n=1 Tax=Cereibacter azotoformans TaxID=43057 RepID=UPI001EEBBAB8|nr:hypothetical protein [Cereibacter azotoformans]ULB12141.1 hypothetical protein ORIO_20240 [Cereibacter azotoformans]
MGYYPQTMRPAFALLILAFLAAPAMADPPEDAAAIDAASALACVSARYRGEALRIEAEDDGLVQEIRWLTPAGNVLDIEIITGPDAGSSRWTASASPRRASCRRAPREGSGGRG